MTLLVSPLPLPPAPVAPALYLLARPSIIRTEWQRFAEDHDLWAHDSLAPFTCASLVSSALPGEQIAEFMGRLDYWSFAPHKRRAGGASAYFARILEQGHTNIIELSHWITVWKLTQGSARDLLRYRTAERSQTSTRYVDYALQPVVLTPGYDEEYDPIFDAQWREAYRRAYSAALEKGTAQGLHGTDRTKYARDRASRKIPFEVVTWVGLATNLQTARHLILQRANCHVRPDLRFLAVRFFEMMGEEAPAIFSDMERYTDSDGQSSVRKMLA